MQIVSIGDIRFWYFMQIVSKEEKYLELGLRVVKVKQIHLTFWSASVA